MGREGGGKRKTKDCRGIVTGVELGEWKLEKL